MAPRRPLQSQAAQGSSRRRRAEVEEKEESSEEDREYQNGDEPSTQAGGTGGLNEDELKAKAARLVRLALFLEYKRRPILRSVIASEILSGNPRAFNAVLARAQKSLGSTFGMELVELRSKKQGAALEASQAKEKGKGRAREEEDEEDGEADGDTPVPAKRIKVTGSKTYILRSTLPAPLLAAVSKPQPLPLFDPDDPEERMDDQDGPADSGALIPWEKADGTASGNIGLFGIRTLILCLVMTMGRVIQDDHLHALLRRLNLDRDTVLPYTSLDAKETSSLTLDKYLDLLARQNYLEKTKIPGPNGTEESATAEWRWGSREAEFSEKAAAEFIEKVFFSDADGSDYSDDEGDARRRRRQNGEQRNKRSEREAARKKLHQDVVKAVGGPLLAW